MTARGHCLRLRASVRLLARPRLMPQVASGSIQALAHAITKGVATTRTRGVVSRVELRRGEPVGFVGVETIYTKKYWRYTLYWVSGLVHTNSTTI